MKSKKDGEKVWVWDLDETGVRCEIEQDVAEVNCFESNFEKSNSR